MPSPRQEASAPSDVTTSWSEPSPHLPESQGQSFEGTGGESVREPVIAEHVVQTNVREHEPEWDRDTTFVTATIDVASGDAQKETDVAAAQYETGAQDEEPRTDRMSRGMPNFELPSDLVQVETSPDRAQDIPSPAPEPRFESRPRRPRAPEEQVPTEALVQVETRH